MPFTTRLTERLGIAHPILLAPMAFVAGGRLAAAVTAAGGMGLIGGGYGDAAWIAREFDAAEGERVGCGFITWSLARQPHLLTLALARKPVAIMLSFGDPRPFAAAIKDAGAALVCQVQTRAQVEDALAAGADIVIAQGAEAGGHGAQRATLPFVPAVVDLVRQRAPDVAIVAAGGIADGRGLAAALALGADGVLMGTRFFASAESRGDPTAKAMLVAASGEETIRTSTVDVVRRLDWPALFTARVLRNRFVEEWHGAEARLGAALATETPRYQAAIEAADFAVAAVFAGEAIGLIDRILPARDLVAATVAGAEAALARALPR